MVENVWKDTSTTSFVFMLWCSIKHGDNLNFTLPFIYKIENENLSFIYVYQELHSSRRF
jgi:hypothetical protein